MFVICCPYYKPILSYEEERNLRITDFYNQNVDKFFLLPDNIELGYYKSLFPNWRIIQLEKSYFEGIESYNKLMLSSKIYKIFSEYKYLVICQADAVLLKEVNKLTINFDYVGAPWEIPIRYKCLDLFIGNGGLSIRRVKSFIRLTNLLFFLKYFNANEDVLFSYLGRLGLIKTPSLIVARTFFCEMSAVDLVSSKGKVGFHALNKWNPKLENLIFKQHNLL